MAEAILTRRSVVKNEYQLLADITVSGSAVTQIDISGLNIGKGEEVVLVATVINGNGAGNILSLFVNGNYTDANYYVQWLNGNGSTAPSGTRMNNSYFGVSSASDTSLIEAKLKLTNNGYFVAQSNCSRDFIGSDIQILNAYMTSTFTITSITSLRILGSVSNLIGIGSRFTLYKVGA